MFEHELVFREETHAMYAIAYICMTTSQSVSLVDKKVIFSTPAAIEPVEQAFLLTYVSAYIWRFNRIAETTALNEKSYYSISEVLEHLNISEWELAVAIVQRHIYVRKEGGQYYINAFDVMKLDIMYLRIEESHVYKKGILL